MMNKLLLIDAYSIICRGFYALPILSNSNGEYTNAVLGFLNILYKTIDDEKPNYIAVAFDENKQTFRHKLYKEYKANRKSMPIELKEQIPYVKQILEASKIKSFSVEGYEADDILGTLSYKFADKNTEVVILTGDRDMLQLPTDNIKIRLIKTLKGKSTVNEYYAKDVYKEFDLTPDEYINLKAIMGDPSDNIKGFPGIGKITATDLISKYKTIDNIYAHIEDITKNSIKKSLLENADKVDFYKNLVTIKKDVPINVNLNDLQIDNLFNNDVYNIISKFEIKSLYKKFSNNYKNKKIEDKLVNPFEDEIDEQIEDIFKNNNVEYDTILKQEVTIVEDFKNIKIDDGEDIAIYCYIEQNKNCSILSLTTHLKTYIIINNNISKYIKQISKNNKVYFINLKEQLPYFDENINTQDRIEKNTFKNFNDLSLMSYIINPKIKNNTYDVLSKFYLKIDFETKKELFGKTQFDEYLYLNSNLDLNNNIIKYFSNNSKVAYLLINILKNKLDKDKKLLDLYENVELPLLYVLYDMEKIGIRLDTKQLEQYDQELDKKISKLQKEIITLAGEDFNINSPKQLQNILFDKLNLSSYLGKNDKISTSIDILQKLKDAHPIINKIIEYRSINKISTTYSKVLPTFVKSDGRIHTNFNQTETATGRLSSDNPNMQNIPIKTELGKNLRKVFIPNKDNVFVDADYSQIELRILAIISNDEQLLNAYKSEDIDVHTLTASQVFDVDINKVTKEMRRKAKAVNFGIIYGMSSFGLSEDLNIDQKEAKIYIDKYFETYKGVKEYLDKVVKDAEINGYVKTYFGRVRYIDEFRTGNGMQKAFAKRVAMNSPIQGTASDIIKMAMVLIDKEIVKQKLNARILLQVHDEILIECSKNEVENIEKILYKCMRDSFNFKIPLSINIEVGNNFEEVH